MKCPGIETLTLYGDRQLPEGKSRTVERHLDGCPRCRETVRSIERAAALTREKLALLAPETIPDIPFVAPEMEGPPKPGAGRLRGWFTTSVRVPVAALIVLFCLFLVLVVGLLTQWRELSALKAPYLEAKKQAEFYLIGEGQVQIIEASGREGAFEPINDPRIFVAREEQE